jgi:hypothetical protein
MWSLDAPACQGGGGGAHEWDGHSANKSAGPLPGAKQSMWGRSAHAPRVGTFRVFAYIPLWSQAAACLRCCSVLSSKYEYNIIYEYEYEERALKCRRSPVPQKVRVRVTKVTPNPNPNPHLPPRRFSASRTELWSDQASMATGSTTGKDSTGCRGHACVQKRAHFQGGAMGAVIKVQSHGHTFTADCRSDELDKLQQLTTYS